MGCLMEFDFYRDLWRPHFDILLLLVIVGFTYRMYIIPSVYKKPFLYGYHRYESLMLTPTMDRKWCSISSDVRCCGNMIELDMFIVLIVTFLFCCALNPRVCFASAFLFSVMLLEVGSCLDPHVSTVMLHQKQKPATGFYSSVV